MFNKIMNITDDFQAITKKNLYITGLADTVIKFNVMHST